MPSKKVIKKVEPEKKEINEPAKRADFKLRNYAEDNILIDISKLEKQLKKLEQSINAHDSELEIKRNDHKELQQRLKELISIQELLSKITI